MILEVALGLVLAYTVWCIATMEVNYHRASSMGIPLVRLIVDPKNIAWLIIEPFFWKILDRLPFDYGTFGRYSRRGWHFHDKAKSHLHYGPAWALVTPGDVYVYVADPDAIHDILYRRGEFLRPSKMYKLLEVYGPCISTASWTDWPRHRKVLAAPFNESIMKFVWDESLNQTNDMLVSWTSSPAPRSPSVAKDTRTLSLDVLAATGFRRAFKFRSSEQPKTDEASTYRDALQIVLDNAILIMILPRWLFSLPLLPKSLARLGKAANDFKDYMKNMLREETALRDSGKEGTGSLMTSFVRALDTHQKGDSSPRGLTVDEIFGNIFVINFAGHDTTANTIAFAALLLAAYPDVQNWVGKEILAVFGKEEQGGDNAFCNWDYHEIFPKLLRCRSVLLETLRLYPPILALPRWTNEHPQELKITTGTEEHRKTITIPPNTGIMPSLLAVQTHPVFWPDPLSWKPSRWINSPPSSSPEPEREETLLTPTPNTFFPWSAGPQNCPGTKFAQVEFVAVLARLLRHHRLELVKKPGESIEMARKRVLMTTEDCDLELLLRMKDADKVRIRCVQVKG